MTTEQDQPEIDFDKARLYYLDGRVEQYSDQALAYSFWLGMKKGVRVAFRGIGDQTPVYAYDYVDRM
jgi:hypothetical protein